MSYIRVRTTAQEKIDPRECFTETEAWQVLEAQGVGELYYEFQGEPRKGMRIKHPTTEATLVEVGLLKNLPAGIKPAHLETERAVEGLYREAWQYAGLVVLAEKLPADAAEREAYIEALAALLIRDATDLAGVEWVLEVVTGTGSGEAKATVAAVKERLDAGGKVRGVPTLREHLGTDGVRFFVRAFALKSDPAEPDPDAAPVLTVNRAQLSTLTAAAIQHLGEANAPPTTFQRDGRLVKVGVNDRNEAHLREFDLAHLADWLSRHMRFVRTGQNSRGQVSTQDVFPPETLVRAVAAAGVYPATLPVLEKIVASPVLGRKGELSLSPGYHPASRSYYHESVEGLQLRPLEATRERVEAALQVLRYPFTDFPFEEDGGASWANCLAALFDPWVKALTGLSPFFLIEAPVAASGKTLLARTLFAAFDPRMAPLYTLPETEEEVRKLLLSIAMRGPSHVIFDNLEGRVKSPALCQALTSATVSDRVLGSSTTAEIPLPATWLSTSNNARLHEDIVSRTVLIRLNAGMEDPAARKEFTVGDPPAWMRDHRQMVVEAALTVLAFWVDQGMPRARSVAADCRFTEWASVMGGILETVGVEGFLDNQKALKRGADGTTDAMHHFTESWFEQWRSSRVGIDDLVGLAFGSAGPWGVREGGILSDALAFMLDNRKDPKLRFSHFMNKQRDRVYGEFAIKWRGGRHSEYSLEPVGKGPGYDLSKLDATKSDASVSADDPRKTLQTLHPCTEAPELEAPLVGWDLEP
jgi:hypothetical protein